MNTIKTPLITPPQSFTYKTALLTPPPTDKKTTKATSKVVQEIQRRKIGRNLSNTSPWKVYKLNEEEYAEVLRLVESDKSLQGFVKDKLRYDYFPSAQRFVIRMPLCVHESFISKIVSNISRQINVFASANDQSPTTKFAQEIESFNSTSLHLQDYGTHDPDSQFAHSQAQWPGIIIEVSFTQKRKDLDRLADDYILGSDGNICAMIGIDIEYRGTKKVTLSIWQPRIMQNQDGDMELSAEQTVTDEVIRDEHGICNTNASLRLPLVDFASEGVSQGMKVNGSLTISATKMCNWLEKAEARAILVEQKRGIVRTPIPLMKKRARSDTPESEVDEETIANRQKARRKEMEAIQKAKERVARNDPEYEPSSSPSDAESTTESTNTTESASS
ncbi:hypothetical protein EAF00_012046 [Botryotinia globosa]|nr:hypothetical protein EAF00_012046 [Botryotinia globosa]